MALLYFIKLKNVLLYNIRLVTNYIVINFFMSIEKKNFSKEDYYDLVNNTENLRDFISKNKFLYESVYSKQKNYFIVYSGMKTGSTSLWKHTKFQKICMK